MDKEIEGKVTDALLQNGVKVKLQNRGIKRLFKKETEYTRAPPTLGVLLAISKAILDRWNGRTP
jgi:hypothetical protein